MPRTASVAKRARQNIARNKRLQPVKSVMKSSVRNVVEIAKSGAKDKSQLIQSVARAYKAIDMAAKKGLIHRNTAARKKSAVAKLVK